MDHSMLQCEEGWLGESFGTAEPLIANGDDLAARKLVRLESNRVGRLDGSIAEILQRR